VLKDRSNSDAQYLLGNPPELTEEALQAMPLTDGVTIEGYRTALAADITGTARKLVVRRRPRRSESIGFGRSVRGVVGDRRTTRENNNRKRTNLRWVPLSAYYILATYIYVGTRVHDIIVKCPRLETSK
jgi:hypothetical protein